METSSSPISNHSSPLSSNNELDSIDLLDSSSSYSSSDQSSPSSDSNYPVDSTSTLNINNNNNWASFHPLALTNLLPNIISSPIRSTTTTTTTDWSESIKSINLMQQQQQSINNNNNTVNRLTAGEMDLTSDFWSTAPNSSGNNDYDMTGQVDFQDVLQREVYSSTLDSPKLLPLPSTISDQQARQQQQPYYTPAFNIPHETTTFSSLGISPLLTSTTRPSSVATPTTSSALPSPPLPHSSHSSSLLAGFNSHSPPLPSQFKIKLEDEERYQDEQEEDEDEDEEEEEQMGQEQDGDRSYSNRASTSASGSGERERERPRNLQQFSHQLSTKSSSTSTSSFAVPSCSSASTLTIPKKEVVSTNLVAKDAIVASSTISSLTTYPISNSQFSSLQLLVLGVPSVGAKSRVETQIKISLVLVRPKGKGKREELSSSSSLGGVGGESEWMTSDGGLSNEAGTSLERIGSWSHLKLPNYLALKKKGKKVAPDPSPEETLYLDVAVKRGSETLEEIFICTGCRQREEKRALRKKEARVRPLKESELPILGAEEEEMKKVVVFNCAEFVEFGNGEVVLPTRITCYCRHHKERLGFSVSFSLTTASGIVVASGATPPIMITDDHKTNHLRPTPTLSSVPSSADVSLDSINRKPPTKTKKAKTPAALRKAELAASKSKRVSGGTKSTRGVSNFGGVESEDELLPEPSARMLALNAANAAASSTTSNSSNGIVVGKKQHGVAKPYDSDSRPSRSKRQPSGVHRSPAFAMTPLSGVSKPSSPVIVPQSDHNSGIPSPPLSNLYDSTAPSPAGAIQSNWETALGLGRMDSLMGEVVDTNTNDTSTSTAYSTSGMSTTSPAHSYDWRSAASSPSANSVVDTYNSFYNTIASPPIASPSNSTNLNNNNHHLVPQLLQQQQQPQMSHELNDFSQFFNPPVPSSVVSSAFNWAFSTPPTPPPRISRLIPGEGPVHGGIEVTILGENFVRDLVCVFGDSAATSTHYWSSNTLVCILPPSANPGPVVVGIKGVPLTVDSGAQLQLFTYKDDSDRSLLELALQVVGLKMTGKLEEASAVAMRIVGDNTPSVSRHNSRQASPNDTVGLAMSMNRAADSVYNTPNSSRPPSRQASIVNLNLHMNPLVTSSLSTPPTLPQAAAGGQSRNFEGIVIKFLSLIDLDPSLIPGSAPSLPLTQSPLSHLNAQRHSLLHLATVLGFHRLSSFLISRGINLEAKDRNGYTALHFSALYGRVAITRQLLDAGAVALVKNLNGETPLDIATERDDVDIQELLLRPRGSRLVSRPISVSRQQQIQQQQVRQRQLSNSTPNYSRRTSFDSNVDYSSSDYDATSASSDDDEESFHSSDEEEGEYSDEEEEEETRAFSPALRSRNASMVSLHYLLDAEADVNSEFGESTFVESIPVSDEKNFQSIIRPTSTTTTTSTATINQGAELARKLSASIPFAPLSSNIEKLPLLEKPPIISITGGGVWEKMPRLPYANEAWEKMRLPNSFAMPPLQMPELSVFNAAMPTFSPKTWMSTRSSRRTAVGSSGNRSDGSISGVEESEGEGGLLDPSLVHNNKLPRDWRTLYGPWWQRGVASPPPPMYSPIDTLQVPVPSTSTVQPISSLRESSSSTIRRRSGFVSEEISDSDIISSSNTYLPQKKKLQGLQHDKMLLCFWLPVLTLAIALAAFSSFDYIRHFIAM